VENFDTISNMRVCIRGVCFIDDLLMSKEVRYSDLKSLKLVPAMVLDVVTNDFQLVRDP
jgi:hypothetical protein